jgi:hypothetical protein
MLIFTTGHSYFVDNCGKPMEIRNCATCGVQIGGQDHNLLGNNRLSNLADMTPVNYVLREVLGDPRADMFQTARSLTPKALRTLRLLMHILLFVGSISIQNHTTASRGLLDSQYANPRNMQDFFKSHMEHDWELLMLLLERNSEETSIVLNDLVHKLSNAQFEGSCPTKDKRIAFENAFCQVVIGGVSSECFEGMNFTLQY